MCREIRPARPALRATPPRPLGFRAPVPGRAARYRIQSRLCEWKSTASDVALVMGYAPNCPLASKLLSGNSSSRRAHLDRAIALRIGRVDGSIGRRFRRCRTARTERAHAQLRAHRHSVGVALRPRGSCRTVQQRADAEPLKRRLAYHVENRVQRDVAELRRHFSVHGNGVIGGLDGDRAWISGACVKRSAAGSSCGAFCDGGSQFFRSTIPSICPPCRKRATMSVIRSS